MWGSGRKNVGRLRCACAACSHPGGLRASGQWCFNPNLMPFINGYRICDAPTTCPLVHIYSTVDPRPACVLTPYAVTLTPRRPRPGPMPRLRPARVWGARPLPPERVLGAAQRAVHLTELWAALAHEALPWAAMHAAAQAAERRRAGRTAAAAAAAADAAGAGL